MPSLAQPQPPVAGQLDHALYEPRVSWRAPARRWPGERSAAACVVIHLEALEIDAPPDAWRDPGLRGDFGSFFPDLRTHSLLEYGTRIGVFRLLDMLQPMGWSVSVAVNGCIAQARPALLRELQGRGVELLASGWSASRMLHSALGPTQELAWLAQSADALAQATGVRAAGYASQDYGYSTRSAGHLEQLGFDHVVDWPNDEMPFAFGPARALVALPPAADLDDAQAMLTRKLLARRWAQTVQAALAHWVSQAHPGAVFVLPLHAWVAGAAHRAAALRRALSTIDAHMFWQAPPSAIARHWRAAGLADSKTVEGVAS
jgi:allantoinase